MGCQLCSTREVISANEVMISEPLVKSAELRRQAFRTQILQSAFHAVAGQQSSNSNLGDQMTQVQDVELKVPSGNLEVIIANGRKLDHIPSFVQKNCFYNLILNQKLHSFPSLAPQMIKELKFEDGAYYQGEIQDDQVTGFGLLLTSDEASMGEWYNKQLNGFGIKFNKNGIEIGNFQKGLRNGFVKLIQENGSTFEGYFIDNVKNGEALEINKKGEYIKSIYKDGVQTGNVNTIITSNQSNYEGELRNNMKHGYGRIIWSDGNTYFGEWNEDMINGFGVFKWADGRSYAGKFNKSVREGLGIFTWPDGTQYEGHFLDNSMNGYGVLTDRKGRSVAYQWSNGKRIKESASKDIQYDKIYPTWCPSEMQE